MDIVINKEQVQPKLDADMLSRNIDSAVKIGKQAMLAELKARLAEACSAYAAAEASVNTCHSAHHDIEKGRLDKAFLAEIKHNSELGNLRNAFNAIQPKEQRFTSIKQMVICGQRWGRIHPIDKIFGGYETVEYDYQLQITRNTIEDNGGQGDEWDDDNTYSLEISVPASTLSYCTAISKLRAEARKCRTAVEDLDQQIKNIDATMEEIEAKMHIKKLRESDEGKAVLDLVKDVVQTGIGGEPLLLG